MELRSAAICYVFLLLKGFGTLRWLTEVALYEQLLGAAIASFSTNTEWIFVDEAPSRLQAPGGP
uniref:Uncharacterized protein n=1 Tax=Oryza barthii TaxID=65489 RepID=A0A0D3G6F2_9ORYZ